MTASISFPYRQNNPFLAVIAAPAFLGAAYFFYFKWQTNGDGLVIDRIIELSPRDAGLFYLALGAVSVVMAVGCAIALFAHVFLDRRIEITQAGLSVPSSLVSATPRTIPWSQIGQLNLSSVYNQKYLVVRYPGGKFSIMEKMLPKQAFEPVCTAIIEATKRAHGRPA